MAKIISPVIGRVNPVQQQQEGVFSGMKYGAKLGYGAGKGAVGGITRAITGSSAKHAMEPLERTLNIQQPATKGLLSRARTALGAAATTHPAMAVGAARGVIQPAVDAIKGYREKSKELGARAKGIKSPGVPKASGLERLGQKAAGAIAGIRGAHDARREQRTGVKPEPGREGVFTKKSGEARGPVGAAISGWKATE